MKMLVVVIQDADANRLREALTKRGFASTRLPSTGGFLREGNTTFMVGVEDEQVAVVKDIISNTCKQRTKLTPTMPYLSGAEGAFSEPTEVVVGGAVVFVLPLDEMLRL